MFRSRYLQILTLALCFLFPVWWWKVARKTSVSSVEFATYNLWNVMFNWEIRKQHIALMINQHFPAVIGLQEVRERSSSSSGSGSLSQLDELQELLPEYKWSAFQWTTNAVDKEAIALGRGGIETRDKNNLYYKEGLAILSRWRMSNFQSFNLSVGEQDKNVRILLTATIHGPLFPFTFAVTHMSYEKKQQCQNVREIKNFLSFLPKPIILVGDTNTYNDFSDPISYFDSFSSSPLSAAFSSSSSSPPSSSCLVEGEDNDKTDEEKKKEALIDAWATVHGTENGYTFSNMPSPGLESRPDRILLSKTWTLLDVFRDGDGTVYKRDFTQKIIRNRFWTAVANNQECIFDCGPHAKCVCGICVKDAVPCPVPCPKCVDADKALLKLIGIPCILLVGFGFACFLRFRHRSKKSKQQRWLRCSQIIILIVFSIFWLEVVWQLRHQPVLNSLYSVVMDIIPEELFPSDHLFLSASVYYRI